MYNAGILTISDAASKDERPGSRDKRADPSADYMTKIFREMDIAVVRYEIVPEDQYVIATTLCTWADSGAVDFIITSGGTGLNPRDVTPEATRSVIQKEVPGIVEIMRMDGFTKTPTAILSRGIAGIRGICLIVNLPPNPKAVQEYLSLILPIIPHAIDTLHGRIGNHF